MSGEQLVDHGTGLPVQRKNFDVRNPTPEDLGLGVNYSLSSDGADKFARFRYQATCAAIFGLAMLDNNSDHIVIFCESLEDFTMQKKDGKLTAVQVKSRSKGLDPLKTSDTEVLSSIHRFSEYETSDPSSFARYIIATNIGFWRGRKDWYNLSFLKSQINNAESLEEIDANAEIRKARGSLTNHRCEIEINIFRSVFDKLVLHDGLPDIMAAQAILGEELRKRCDEQLTIRQFEFVVIQLIDLFCRHSSRAHEDVTATSQVLAVNPDVAVGIMRMESRMISLEMLRSHIDDAVVRVKQLNRLQEDVEEEIPVSESIVKFTSLTDSDASKLLLDAIKAVNRYREQFEWEKANEELLLALRNAQRYQDKISSKLAYEIYVLAAEVEAENALHSNDEKEKEDHLIKAKAYIEKAVRIREN